MKKMDMKMIMQICEMVFCPQKNGIHLIPVSSMGMKSRNQIHLKDKYVTYYNTKRSDINASVFRNYLKTYHNVNSGVDIPYTAIVIKAATNWAKSKTPLSFDQGKVLFEECPEWDVKKGTSQMCAPLLCLFFGCDLMVTENEDVLEGIANGTDCKVRKLVLKQDAKLEKIKMYDYWVHAVGTENIEHIEVEWQDCEHFVGKF
jgi:hypothetical protein